MRIVSRPSTESGSTAPTEQELRRIQAVFRRWAILKDRIEEQTRELDSLREELLEFAARYGEENAKGHRTYELPGGEYVTPSGKSYAGWTREKRSTTRISVDRARELAEEKGITNEVFKEEVIEVLDQDALYRLQQEDVLTRAELDNLFDTTTTYALKGL